MGWVRLVSNSSAGNVKMNIDYYVQSVTRTSNTNVRVVYGIRFKQVSSWTQNSVACWTPAGGTRRWAFNNSSGSTSHTDSSRYYLANTGNGTSTTDGDYLLAPFTQDITVTITQTSASFEVGYGWNAFSPSQQGKSAITVTFPTGATAPTGLSCSYSSLTETSVSLSGSYASDGNATVTSTGFQYKTESGSWTNCSSSLSGLSPGTKYYFRYYATNSQGTSYSDGTTNATTYNYPYITGTPNFTIGNTLTISIYNPLGRRCYIYIKGANGEQNGGDNTTGTSISGYTDSGWKNFWYRTIPNSKSGTYQVRLVVTSPYSRDTTVTGGTYSIKDNGTEIPNFSTSNWTYSADLTSLTNNNQCIIKDHSTVTFSVNTAATSSYGASIVKYVYKWGNKTKDSTSGNSLVGGNTNILEVDAVDSRGLIKATTITLVSGQNYVPYNIPALDYSNSYTHRTDGISNETKITLRGNLSVMKFGASGVNNALYITRYRVYNYSTNQWSGPYTIPTSSFTLQSSGYFSLNDYLIHANGSSGGFEVGKRYGIEVQIFDGQGIAGLYSSIILVTDGKIARDVYQDSNGDYHQGINGMATNDYVETIYGDTKIDGDISINSLISSSGRQSNPNFTHQYPKSKASERYDICTSSMDSSGYKPYHDGFLKTMFWDNSGQYDTQLFIPNGIESNGKLQIRSSNGSNWTNNWKDIPILDGFDYGEWTPRYLNCSYSNYEWRKCMYIKLGKIVILVFHDRPTISSITGNGNAIITGLPYAPIWPQTGGGGIGTCQIVDTHTIPTLAVNYDYAGIELCNSTNDGATVVHWKTITNGWIDGTFIYICQ